MGTIWFREFTGGLDTRRMPETTSGGVLIKASNGHINRGGEFEKRAAFVPEYTLPDGTVGLAGGSSSLYAFGSAVAPTMPSGILYQRLQHPDGVTALNRVLSVDMYAGKLYVVGEFADGAVFHYYDGTRVTDWYDGRARASFQVVSGQTTPSVSTLTSLTVGGVAIISGTVAWSSDAATMASAIATAINSFTSSPDYTAVAAGDTVSIVAATAGAAANGRNVVFGVSNSLVLNPASGLKLANGSDASAFQPGTFVKTIGKKMYSTSGPNTHFSGISAPTKWTTNTTGAGFIDMSSEASGSEALVALGKYQSQVAVFAERVVQIWYMDPDPTLNRQSQVLNNTGTISPKSVTQFGDNDLFYLDESGLRSLKARDSSNAAATTDIGVPIDTLIIEKLQELALDERRGIIGIIEPRDGRFWLAIKDTIYVFSFFNGAKVSAWSTYTPSIMVDGVAVPFTVDEMIVFQRRVYIRSGNTIYVYGGISAGLDYDATVAEAWLPYLDANAPTRAKKFTGIDAAVKGDWGVYVAMQPNNPDAEDKVAVITETTFNENGITADGESTHVSLRFRTAGDGYAKLSSAVIHYEGDQIEDK